MVYIHSAMNDAQWQLLQPLPQVTRSLVQLTATDAQKLAYSHGHALKKFRLYIHSAMEDVNGEWCVAAAGHP